MGGFAVFFLVLLASLFFSGFFRQFHFPWVVSLIIGGIIIGPYGFNLFTPDQTIEFFGEIGLVFLMFMAGLETRFSSFKKQSKGLVPLAVLNGLIPFVVGFCIGKYFDYSNLASLLIGIIFISSSIAIIIPSLEVSSLIHKKIGKTIVSLTILEDIFSLILLSVLFQRSVPTDIPLPLFYVLLVVILIFLKWAIPRVEKIFIGVDHEAEKHFHREIRSIFTVLIGTVVVFEVLGLHPIIAGFFAGLVLSESIRSKIIKEKIHTISYGLFIPIFFILVGSTVNVSLVFATKGALSLAVAILAGSIISKILGGFIGGKLSKFSGIESLLIGVSTIPQLSTTLAVVTIGYEIGLLDQNILVSMVILSVVSTMAGPILIAYYSKRVKKEHLHAIASLN